MRLAIAMLTAPRPHGATIGAALESLRDAGCHETVHVFDDGAGLELADPYTVIYPRAQRLGSAMNFCSALRTILGLEADWFLVLEDDTSWSAPGRGRYVLEEILQSPRITDSATFGALSLHCTRYVSRVLEREHRRAPGALLPGLYESKLGAHTWGAQALVFSRASAQQLIGALAMPAGYLRSDQAVGGALQSLGLALYYWLPCLVRHELGLRNSSSDSPAVLEAPGRGCDYLL